MAIRLNPQADWAYQHRGIAYNEIRESAKALADFNEAIRLNPKNAGTYADRGKAVGLIGNYDKAITDFNEAIRLDPNLAAAYYGRGLIREQFGEKSKADAESFPGHRGLYASDSARSLGSCKRMTPGATPTALRANTTKPSPTAPKLSGSTQKTPLPSAIGDGFMKRKVNMTRRLPIVRKPFGSTQSTLSHITTEAVVTMEKVTKPKPKPISSKPRKLGYKPQ